MHITPEIETVKHQGDTHAILDGIVDPIRKRNQDQDESTPAKGRIKNKGVSGSVQTSSPNTEHRLYAPLTTLGATKFKVNNKTTSSGDTNNNHNLAKIA